MTKQELIKTINTLKAKKKDLQSIVRMMETVESASPVLRQINTIQSLCDRLVFNWNMKNDAMHEGQKTKAGEFLENCIAEAELFVN